MLHKEAVNNHLMELLVSLMTQSYLRQFRLVWWTNLALRYGHRASTDIDLFSDQSFDTEWILSQLQQSYPSFKLVSKNDHMIFGFINDIKIDIIYLPYQFLQPYEMIEDIRFAHVDDILAMKISAIVNRWSKKDFRDLALCTDGTISMTIQALLSLYQTRYKTDDVFHVIRSLIYFDDADEEPDPLCFHDKSRDDIKISLITYCRDILPAR